MVSVTSGILREQLLMVYRRMLERYGPQHWWPGESAFEITIGAVLTQAASWGNVEKALCNLKQAGVFSPKALREIPDEDLARLIYPCGYFNAKARKLKSLAHYLGERFDDDLDALTVLDTATLRGELLAVYGIGEETADAIMLYVAQKPSFVIDTYTRRIVQRLGLAPLKDTYSRHQALFMDNLPQETSLFNEYHALLDRHGKETCRKKPLCEGCCLLNLCPTGGAKVSSR
ncbi:MAG: hypothetical protein HY666_05625 [Chloroflexi bacterium]|nr:hypothetical protein [Chloroflexota bacterium]